VNLTTIQTGIVAEQLTLCRIMLATIIANSKHIYLTKGYANQKGEETLDGQLVLHLVHIHALDIAYQIALG